MFNSNEIAAQFGGTTDKLVKGKEEYNPRTVEQMAGKVIKRIDETIEVLTAYEGGKLSAPMARLVRNGLAIKIGYGSKNESIPGIEVERFWIRHDKARNLVQDGRSNSINYLVAMKETIIAGKLEENFEGMLESYRNRAEKGKAARSKVVPLAA